MASLRPSTTTILISAALIALAAIATCAPATNATAHLP